MKPPSKYSLKKGERHIPVFTFCSKGHKLFEVKPIKGCYQCKKEGKYDGKLA